MSQSKSIGEAIKAKRQEMSLTLKEVENATSIRINYLRAIEEGEVKDLISPVYAKGFIKQYAIFLGLDGDRIISENFHDLSSDSRQEFSYGIGTLEVRGSPGSNVKWLPNVFWLGVSVFVILGAWFLAKYLEVI